MNKTFDEYLPLFSRIDEFIQSKKRVIVGIDGNSASGKSTLASLLKANYSCNIFSMDDFFLRPVQRTQERYNEVGGNIDYERFNEEIIKPLKSEKSFYYQPYDCQTMTLSEPIWSTPNPVNVIEGVYSLHPSYIEAYDIKVFMAVDENEQRRRLFERNAELYNRFLYEWIPLENKYFSHFHIPEQCDIVFSQR